MDERAVGIFLSILVVLGLRGIGDVYNPRKQTDGTASVQTLTYHGIDLYPEGR